MITFPCAKINLGLNIIGERSDGYHDIETVFYPVPLYDALEVKHMDDKFPSDTRCDLKITGNDIDGNESNNLVVRAYNILAKDYQLPRIHTHLHKSIPIKAGLGGGSSDGAFMIRLLDERFRLNIGVAEMERYASKLGADCAFFITAQTAFAEGIGDILSPADTTDGNLNGYYLTIVKPDIDISTGNAYKGIVCKKPAKSCKQIVRQPIETWKDELINDFEETVFKLSPLLADIKRTLYDKGALYASMSGSGSAIYGIFKEDPMINDMFKGMFVRTMQL